MARIAIVGVGAIGGVIACLLEHADLHEVVPCMRQATALTVETPDRTLNLKATPITDPEKAEPVDWVFVATKAYDVAGAAKWLQHLRLPPTPVAVLQNGVEHRERLAPYIPVDAVLPVVIDCPVERRAPGKIRQRGPMKLKVAQGELGSAFADLFAKTTIQVEVTDDFPTVAWKKLCLNSAGILPALLLQPAGVLKRPAVADLAAQVVKECIAVGRAEGARLDDCVIDEVLKAYRSMPANAINSLHADRLAGRPMEIDARNGVIVRLGEKHRIPTPVNRTLVALLEATTPKRGNL